ALGVFLGSSSPLRGVATCPDGRLSASTFESSSPLRGVATKRASCFRPWGRSSSPLRGVATGRRGRRRRRRACPHRPYEGSQPDELRLRRWWCVGPHRPYEGSQPKPALERGTDSPAATALTRTYPPKKAAHLSGRATTGPRLPGRASTAI